MQLFFQRWEELDTGKKGIDRYSQQAQSAQGFHASCANSLRVHKRHFAEKRGGLEHNKKLRRVGLPTVDSYRALFQEINIPADLPLPDQDGARLNSDLGTILGY